jgi:hypothetical protein
MCNVVDACAPTPNGSEDLDVPSRAAIWTPVPSVVGAR